MIRNTYKEIVRWCLVLMKLDSIDCGAIFLFNFCLHN